MKNINHEECVLPKKEYPGITIVKNNDFNYIKFDNLTKYDKTLMHAFTTRNSGVSVGAFESLNLGLYTEDDFNNVLNNYKISANNIGFDLRNIVFSKQVHGDKIRIVTKEDCCCEITPRADVPEFDAMVTSVPNVVLTCFFADCVPIFYYDKVANVVALAHSGWKGTYLRIGAKVIDVMMADFGCKPQDIEVSIGPSIGSCCFTVDDELYNKFLVEFSAKEYYSDGVAGKKTVDLRRIIASVICEKGVLAQNVYVSSVCTMCNKDMFFSHRAQCVSNAQSVATVQCGRLAGFIAIKELFKK